MRFCIRSLVKKSVSTESLAKSARVQILARARVDAVPHEGGEAPVVGHVHGEVGDGSAGVGEDVHEPGGQFNCNNLMIENFKHFFQAYF